MATDKAIDLTVSDEDVAANPSNDRAVGDKEPIPVDQGMTMAVKMEGSDQT